MSDLTVANTIVAQLGGNKFVAMTGAKNLMGGERVLQFKLPARFAKDGINSVRVELNDDDTYTMIFYKIKAGRFFDVKVIHTASQVYADNLRSVFTQVTGLETSLGTMGAAR